MLKLKRVEIQGFKSFLERSELRFHGDGIAAIVGPNGCGKSNLSDAISWVLGEQSAKTLRGARMEDVIFAGTRDRKPLSMAQVTMTLVDPNHSDHFPPGLVNGNSYTDVNGRHKPHEITITRRLFRNGDSEYLVDGKHSRLRDIQDLFMGTGLGPESYAIIEQGRIGQLLSSKPADRRAVIEEAAGVSKFKTRRRLAEAKLESAKQNLSRVFDILEEVGRQANSLKRQAAKAKRFHELHAEMAVQLRQTLVGRYRLLERETGRISGELNLAQEEFQKLSAEVASKEKDQQGLQERCYAKEAELTARREDLAGLRLEAERTRGRLESQAREIGNIDARLAQGETDAQAIDQQQADVAAELQAHGQRLMELEQQVEEARAQLDAKNKERESLQSGLRERENAIEAGRQQVLRLLGEASSLKNQLAQAETYLESLERDRCRISREEQMAAADLERLEGRKQEVSGLLAASQIELESTTDKRRRVEGDLNQRRQAAGDSRKQLDQIRGESSRLRARRDSLDEILSHRAYTTESVKRLFSSVEQGQAHELQPVGVLADYVDVDAAYEKAAEEFLHEELEWVIVKDWPQAEVGIDLMRTDLDGRATFLVHPEAGDRVAAVPALEPSLGPETGIAARLSDVLHMTNGLTQAPAALIPRLSRCFLAGNRASAQRLARQYPDFYFLLSDGICYHGHAVSGGRKTGSGPLALKRELRELTALVASRQRAEEETALQLQTLEHEIALLGEELERLRTEQQGKEKEALALDHEIRRLAEEFARAGSKLSVARLELQRIEKENARALETREKNQQVVLEKDRARAAQEEALAAARRALEEIQQQVSRVVEEHSVLRVGVAEQEERRRAEAAAQARLESQSQAMLRRRQEIAQDMQRLGVERAHLLRDNIGLDERAGILAGEIGASEQQVATLSAEETAMREELLALDEWLRGRRQEAQTAHEKRGQVELLLVERRAERKYLDETCQKELKVSLDDLAQCEGAELDEIGLAEAEEKYQQIKTRIENLGPVNPQALEEFEEAQQRYDFLNAQRQDLLDSIRDTEKAIQEIDVESKRRFTEAFEAINHNFKETFTKLFGGGMAEMRLTDESNVNDSGIDLIASPPGKRLQNVLLLSGGEKALTALSLLMAIFRYTPSPFCILDEVDAPLDEPNIQRLMGLLKEMAGQSQFIVITHAKRTMEAAASLYGVTMQEPGVSKLVSVRFNPPPPTPVVPTVTALHA
ncbi:MAG: chromosome segregation protein SMC [Acidobacteriia bacterium]|nr:chromosome segregation protein SMC [Terriglobia bacterium]